MNLYRSVTPSPCLVAYPSSFAKNGLKCCSDSKGTSSEEYLCVYMIPSYLFQHKRLSLPTDVPNLWKFIMSMNLVQTYEAQRKQRVIYFSLCFLCAFVFDTISIVLYSLIKSKIASITSSTLGFEK
jgi:hypothetical protein